METPRPLDEPVLEEYPVSHEQLVDKLNKSVQITAEYTDSREETQQIPVTFIPGNGYSKETIIINTPWSDSAHRDFNILRHAALAQHIGADVIIVGFPGHDEQLDSRATSLQREEMTSTSPSFSEAGKALASAVSQISKIEQIPKNYWAKREVTLAGYSQGASTQIGMLMHLDESIARKVSDIYIWESPDMLEPQKKAVVGAKFAKDGTKAGPFFKENEQVFGKEEAKSLEIHDKGLVGIGELLVRLTNKPGELFSGSADAIANSTLEKDLKLAIDRLEGVRIQVINGGDSIVSPPAQGEKLVNAIIKGTSLPAEVNHFVRPADSHPAQESFARYSSTIKEIKEK